MAFDVWAAGNAANVAALNAYGTLTLNGDGTYSFVLDNTRAATQALTAGSTLSYNLNYTMKDADGDTSPATLTIVIKGADDGSSVVTAQATGPDGQVLEHGLVVAADSETTTGSFTVSTTDGIQNVVIGGTTFTYAQLTNAAYLASHPVNTGEGVLTLTGFTGTAFGGTVNYSYTLSATIDNDSKAGATPTGFDDSVVLTVNGIGGTTASDDLVIRIVDDTPTVGDFHNITAPNTAGVTYGLQNTGFISGADSWNAINITGPAIAGITYRPQVVTTDGNGHVLSTTLIGEETGSHAAVFSYTVTADGHQSFDLIKPEASSVVTVDLANLAAGGPIDLRELADYSVEFQGTGINVSSSGIGIGNNLIDVGETLTLEFFKNGQGSAADDTLTAANARLVGSVDFTDNHQGGTYAWTATNTITGAHESGTVTMAGGAHFTIDPSIDFDRIEMTATAGSMRPNDISYTEKLVPDGKDLTFYVTGTDGDGDVTAQDPVTVHIQAGEPDAFAPTLFSLDSAPETPLTTHTATDGADTLLATNDADNFVWSLADHTAQGDTIVGFNGEADAINIADILADTVNTTDFSSYLNVSLEGASTVLRISSTGDFAHADQVITVQDVNLFEGVDFSDTAALTTALQNMVDAGKLITDH